MQQPAQRLKFPFFQTPLDLAHAYWLRLLKPGNRVIDATCGNGHDTLFLANLVLNSDSKGSVIALDKQQLALDKTQALLKANLSENFLSSIFLYAQCHSSFPLHLEKESISLIVYNLGYLPGGDKNLTTISPTTLQSLEAAISLIVPGGAISITCYPGHDAGKPEEEAVLKFTASLDPKKWSCCHHQWVNRQKGPSLILIQKGFSLP